ncbi:hypothetical protein Dda_3510 [Drechslerella dactyloides]|uniref:Ribosomal protein/NADH dehydrogenase domain-containing protein n=1 Tax=Drechslerella dactyloides TaxID=74499 RepID=A0AAD6IY37_DREDA|nr:hypothetical protein Dda_3510 [Drechslerella dactyloides]
MDNDTVGVGGDEARRRLSFLSPTSAVGEIPGPGIGSGGAFALFRSQPHTQPLLLLCLNVTKTDLSVLRIMAARFTFTKQLKELRFHLCQTGAASTPLRSFITKSYPTMKKNNPDIPILIREAQGTSPRVFARYELGKETQVPLSDLSEAEIESKVSAITQSPP